jgi:lysophospholipase L1-like esterase
MLISNSDELHSIFKNYLELNSDSNKITFSRFTEKQFKCYDTSEAVLIRSKCPSGVCLDFWTDSKDISFEYSIKDMARKWLYFDIYVNDIFVESTGRDIEEKVSDKFYYVIPETNTKLNKITIYLPHLVEMDISNFQLSDGAVYKKSEDYSGNLLCLGDSITQGMSALHPSNTFPVQLSRFLRMNLLNQGVGSYVFNKNSLDKDMPFQPDIITVAYGINDWARYNDIEEFKKNCTEYIDSLINIYQNAKIFVITPIWISSINIAKPMGSFFELAKCIENICLNKRNITVINGIELVPNMPDYFGDKSVHPSDEGFMHYSINLLRNMRAELF